MSPVRTRPGSITRAFMPRSRRARPAGEFTKRIASDPNRPLNFAHPVCGSSVTSMTAEPSAEARARRKILRPQIEIDVELISGKWPAFPLASDERDDAGVHQRELCRLVHGLLRGLCTRPPAIAYEALVQVEHGFLENFPLALCRPADDELYGPLGRR